MRNATATKAAAHTLLEERRERLIRHARRVLLRRLLAEGTATIDDVRAAVAVPTDVDPKFFGAVPLKLAKAGIIAKNGYAESERAEAHGRPVIRWRLIDRAKAEAWLAANPADAPTPPPARRGPVAQPSLFGDTSAVTLPD
ncbi:hypothetical protein [Limnoglobus roseus]|uniref:Uncharacterized protein n=1 Tax=Limnoglobus roseus TaxID=2598579 RepID=A0A5C1A4K6_9BACT|nr:hypothetical protein [Limnoglobus roseus]QEL14039.1 hypothetical protein PX52LOC_00902 [Limnoglobus roseus]